MKFGQLCGQFSKWDYISSFHVYENRSEVVFISEGEIESKDHVVVDNLIGIAGPSEVEHKEIGADIHVFKFIFR